MKKKLFAAVAAAMLGMVVTAGTYAAKKAPPAGEDPAEKMVGEAAPEFNLEALAGGKVSLKELKGSVVVIDFWATWCGPCQQSLPGLDKVYSEHKADGLKVFAVNLREDKPAVAANVKKLGLTMPVLFDKTGAVAKLYKVTGIPQTVVIGKDGKVAKVLVGSGNEENIKTAVEAAMKAKA